MKKLGQAAAEKLGGLFSARPEGQEIPRPESRTGPGCLALAARHHGLRGDENEICRDAAFDGHEPTPASMLAMAERLGMKAKALPLTWEKALAVQDALPALCRKKSGTWFILSGKMDDPEGGPDPLLAVVDPMPEPDAGEPRGGFLFWSRAQFEERAGGGDLILAKRRWKWTDEDRPFSLSWFIPEFIKLKGVFAQIALAVLCMTLLSLAIPLYFQIVVDKALPNSAFTTLNVLGFGVCCAVLFNAAMEWLRSWLLLFASRRIDVETGVKTFAKLMKLPVSFFEQVPTGLIVKHMQQAEQIRGFLSGSLFFTILDLFSLAVFIPVLALYSGKLTGVVLGFAALMALVVACLIKPFQRRLDTLYQAEGRRQSRLVESLHGIHTVKSLALEPMEEKAWNDATAFSCNSYFSVGKISAAAGSMSQALEALMQVAVIWIGAGLVFGHEITIGALIAFQMLSGRVSGPLVKMVGLVHQYQQIALSVKMLGAVMNTPSEHPGGGVKVPLRGGASFENVSFRYGEGLPDALHDVSLEILPGETVGIVGRSGSGKSTMAKLLQAMYSPQRGVVKIDGVDVRELDKAHLRRSIGVVLQENYFFHGTVRENVGMTKPGAAPEEIVRACMLSGAHEFVTKLPKGYDTVLEENASNLSGGQKQRLAIARALITDPRILILDEATSALDPESERIVQENLESIARGRTVIVISHRLSMVRGAAKIAVVDSARIIACAPHDVLVNREGLYREFWNQQTGRA